MANFFEDIAAGAKDIGGKLAQGVGNILVEKTQAGPLLDPFIETSKEKRLAKKEMFAQESRDFQSQQQQRITEQQVVEDEAKEVKRQQVNIAANKDVATKNTQAIVGAIPEYQNLTDIDKNKVFASEPMQDLINFKTLSRVGLEAQSDPRKMDTFKRALQEQGMDFVQKDDKSFLVHPEGGMIELTDNNAVKILNGLQEQAAEEVKAYAQFAAQETNLKGQGDNSFTRAIVAKSQADSTTGQGKSLSSAQKDLESFYEINRFSPQQERIHYVNTGLTRIFEDGNISAEERQDVNIQLEMLGQAIGIESRQTAEGGIEVLEKNSKSWIPLKAFYDSMQNPGVDEISDRFNEMIGGGGIDSETAGEAAVLVEAIPERHKAEASEVLAPLFAEVGFSSKERESIADSFSQLLLAGSATDDIQKIHDVAVNLADEKDLPLETIIQYAPKALQVPIQQYIEQIETDRAAKKAKRTRDRLTSQRKSGITDARKSVPSGFF